MTVVNEQGKYTVDELCMLVGLTRRTVRYYVQIGLVPGPDGETRAARYGQHHVDRLLAIKKWTQAGLSLDRVRELIAGAVTPPGVLDQRPGDVRVWSRLVLDYGVELHVEPGSAQLSPEELREFCHGAFELLKKTKGDKS
jgi:DNA-binding transcriptional MerR regulator